MFKVGDKVVCINAKSANTNDPAYERCTSSVNEKDIYVISEIWEDCLSFVGLPYDDFYESHDFKKLDYAFVERVLEQIKEQPIEA